MSIRIYNTLTRKKKEFKPIKDGHVGMYVCGPTVYDVPHIGHARSAYVFDVIRRYFIYKGYKVKFVRNITDVDDKIINKAKEEFKGEDLNSAVKKVSDKYIEVYHKHMNELGIMQPDIEPRATEYIEKMKDFIKILVEREISYVSGGDVYFDVRKANGYGKLSNQSFEMLESGARIAPEENKKDPLDFALWKSAKADEPSWPSPWGNGRPGWHIECSVMSSDILGDEFDIHGGGVDLVFPHHENEVAQSEGAGKKFSHYWIHNGLLTINKEKMAKSLGNFITIEDVLAKYSADVLKILFLQTHYSHPVDFSWERMEEAKKAYDRFSILLDKVERFGVRSSELGVDKEIESFRIRFEQAMDNDFNTPEALAALFDFVTYINREVSSNRYMADILMGLGKVFGLFETEKVLSSNIIKGLKKIVNLVYDILKDEKGYATTVMESMDIESDADKIKLLIDLRNKARQKKDFKLADKIRQELDKIGIILEDTKDTTTWRIK